MLFVAALALGGLVALWIASEGARFPRDARDVARFYTGTIQPALVGAVRVVQASVNAGARTAEAERRRNLPPPPSPAVVDAFVRAFAAELVRCGGDSRPRIVRVSAHPSGRVDAVTSPDDAAARCLTGSARAWRMPAFDGDAVTVDVPGVLLGTRPP